MTLRENKITDCEKYQKDVGGVYSPDAPNARCGGAVATQNLAQISDNFKRGPGGRFLPGSGGRPRGSKNKAAAGIHAAIVDLGPQAVAVLKNRLNANDVKSALAVLKWILPDGRLVELESADPAGVSTALVNGEITPGEVAAMAGALSKLQSVEEVGRLRERLDELEMLILNNGKS